jgi:hypothetical protein
VLSKPHQTPASFELRGVAQSAGVKLELNTRGVQPTRLMNNAQVLTFGQVVCLEVAGRLAGEWFAYSFDVTSACAPGVDLITASEGIHCQEEA